MHVDHQAREVGFKIVYHGPPLSGKTTNLQALRDRLPSSNLGRLLTLETRDHRTLFLDILPVSIRTQTAYRVRLQLVTVPGQVMHEATRRVLLEGVDGVVFVADSQVRETSANNSAFRELQDSLDHDTPVVIQFNKQDMPAVRGQAELDHLARTRGVPVVGAVALRGQGVHETLARVLSLVWRRHATQHGLEALLGFDERGFVDGLVGA